MTSPVSPPQRKQRSILTVRGDAARTDGFMQALPQLFPAVLVLITTRRLTPSLCFLLQARHLHLAVSTQASRATSQTATWALLKSLLFSSPQSSLSRGPSVFSPYPALENEMRTGTPISIHRDPWPVCYLGVSRQITPRSQKGWGETREFAEAWRVPRIF